VQIYGSAMYPVLHSISTIVAWIAAPALCAWPTLFACACVAHGICNCARSILSGIAATMLEKASSVQEASKGKALEWRKIVKGKVSSQFERFMLQLTWPDDSAIDPVFTAVSEAGTCVEQHSLCARRSMLALALDCDVVLQIHVWRKDM
jgi:hypothetical protein